MKTWIYYTLALLLLTLHSCHEELFKSDDIIIDEVVEDCTLNDVFVDEYGNEGIIAYISDDDFWGDCIIAISADESYESWGPMGEVVYKAEGIAFDTFPNYYILYHPSFGLMMQQSMKSMGISRFPAQQWCDEKNHGEPYPSAASWRLPTLYEWVLITKNTGLNAALLSIGGTPLDDNNYYWTCTEDIDGYVSHITDSLSVSDQENRAIPVNPSRYTYDNSDYWIKKNKYHVRAIKYVYYKN